jgi:hypothetical protein
MIAHHDLVHPEVMLGKTSSTLLHSYAIPRVIFCYEKHLGKIFRALWANFQVSLVAVQIIGGQRVLVSVLYVNSLV